MRQTYETKDDRERETEIATICARAWDCEALKLKIAAELDYVFHRGGEIHAVVEIKDRTSGRGYSSHDMDRMGGYMISACKYQSAKRWCETHTSAFVLIVRLTDGIFWRRWTQTLPRVDIALGGRSDRGDWQDKEPCVFLPMSTFTRLRVPPQLAVVTP